jgi:CRISPR-associated endoribonuclease Cas6
MRLNVVFSFQSLKLPINYNHILQAFILQLIDDAKFRSFLHNQGYTFKNRNYKMFTFSKLNGKFSVDNSEKTNITNKKSSYIHFNVNESTFNPFIF